MRKQYQQPTRKSWLVFTGLLALALTGRAQMAPPVQWQRVIEGGEVTPARVRAANTSNGGYAILAGTTLVRLSPAGAVLASSPLTGTYRDSTATYVPVRETIALAATSDGGATVLALDALNLYYVTKLDATGNRVWTRPVANANTGIRNQLTASALMAAPDRSLLVAGTFTDGFATYLTLTKLSGEGYITGQWRIRYGEASAAATPVVSKILATADGGYLLAGGLVGATPASGVGLILKLDKDYKLTAQRTYPAVTALTDVVVSASGGDVYTAIGLDAANTARVLTIAPNGATDGQLLASLPGSYPAASLVNDGSGNLTLLDATGLTNSDFRLTLASPSAVRWTKTFGGTGNDVPAALLTTDEGGYLLVGTTTSTNGDVVGKPTNSVAAWVVKLGTTTPATALSLTQPTYNCQTGVIVFNSTGGDGTPITYNAPGIGRAQLTDNFGTVEPGVRNDPKPLIIRATQGGQTVSYTFDFAAYCRNQPTAAPPAPGALTLIAPTYNCQTGAITFRTTGGDGTPIEFAAPGITNWTTNPSQFVEPGVRTDYSIQPLTLMARQNGRVIMYVFDLKAECGRARIGVDAPAGLGVSVVGNPVREVVRIDITGAEGQALELHLADGQGRLIEHRTIDRAGVLERQTFDLRQQAPGVLFLRTTAGRNEKTVKVMKQ